MAAIEEDGGGAGPRDRRRPDHGSPCVTRHAEWARMGRAISVPLTPVTRGLSRPLADTPARRPGHVTGPDGTDSQADSASSILVTRSKQESPGQEAFYLRTGCVASGRFTAEGSAHPRASAVQL